jgi:hypothetical protein
MTDGIPVGASKRILALDSATSTEPDDDEAAHCCTGLQWFKTKAHGLSRGMKPTSENQRQYSRTLLSVISK